MKLNLFKSKSSDQTLIDGCLQGDIKAQKGLYEKYSDKMFGVCLRYIKDRGEAEGTMVAAFMKVFEKIGQFKNEGSFEGWIRRIMVNESLTYIRKNKGMYLEVDIEEADKEPDFNSLGHQLEAEDLLLMINKLPTGYKTVFNLYAIEGYTHREISERLGISENTSKSQLSRARALLQSNLVKSEQLLKTKLKGYE